MKKYYLLIVVILLCIFACAKKEAPIPGERGGHLVIGTADITTTISPLAPSVFGSNEILDLLFMKLHRVDPLTGKMIPELAQSWEFSEDLTSVTYYLRKDVKWWDGHSVNSEDVLYTYEKMKDPKTNYPRIANLRFIKNVEILDPHTIKFTFDRVYADLLMDSDIMPVPKHIYERLGVNFGKDPMGNGPYRIKAWQSGVELFLIYNDSYYRGRPPLDEIIVKYYTDVNEMVQDFEAGNLDLVLNITPNAAQDLTTNKNIAVISKTGNAYTYIGWNLKNSYLADKDIRSALSRAINTQQLLTDVFLGLGTISLGPLPPASWGYNAAVKPIAYDPNKAKEILRNKGFEDRNRNGFFDKDGKDFTLNIITNVENQERVDMLLAIANDLKALGIKVNPQTLDVQSFIEAIVNKNFDGFIMGWRVDENIDPTVYFHSDPNKGKLNFVSYQNETIDSLIDLGVTMLDRKKAKALWAEFQKVVYEDLPYTFLVVPNNISAGYKRIRGTDQGINVAQAHTYWIPEAERRIAVVTPTAPQKPTLVPTKSEKKVEVKPPVIEPEKILEAAVKKDTAKTGVAPETLPVIPPPPPVVKSAVPIKQITPKYPESASIIGASGRVVVLVLVGTDGKVKRATLQQSFGNPACEKAALAAAQQWEFSPATRNDVPFEQNVSIPFDFRP